VADAPWPLPLAPAGSLAALAALRGGRHLDGLLLIEGLLDAAEEGEVGARRDCTVTVQRERCRGVNPCTPATSGRTFTTHTPRRARRRRP
jgi:hypothetical protein